MGSQRIQGLINGPIFQRGDTTGLPEPISPVAGEHCQMLMRPVTAICCIILSDPVFMDRHRCQCGPVRCPGDHTFPFRSWSTWTPI